MSNVQGITPGKFERIDNYLITGRNEGMVSFDESVRRLLTEEKITRAVLQSPEVRHDVPLRSHKMEVHI